MNINSYRKRDIIIQVRLCELCINNLQVIYICVNGSFINIKYILKTLRFFSCFPHAFGKDVPQCAANETTERFIVATVKHGETSSGGASQTRNANDGQLKCFSNTDLISCNGFN
jgi:hypothetical protein